MTALENRASNAYSKEDEVTKRYLRFLAWQLERATKDPEWNGQLKDMVDQFKEFEN
jgi:hypothetical protein